MRSQYRVNFGNGQVHYVSSKRAGLDYIKGDDWEQYCRIEKYIGDGEWVTVARGAK